MENNNSKGLAIMGLGVLVAGAGKMVGGRLGAGMTGFGLAHVILGLADMFRPAMSE